LAISFESLLESLLALQDIAEIGVGFGEIWPQGERPPEGLDGLDPADSAPSKHCLGENKARPHLAYAR
jgi:hypothetical protein